MAKKKRNKAYKPKQAKPLLLSSMMIGLNLYDRLHSLLHELMTQGTANYDQYDNAIIEQDDGNFFYAVEVVQSAMRFLAIYESVTNVSFKIDYIPFERLANQLESEQVYLDDVKACFKQLDRLQKAYNAMNPKISLKLINKYRLQSEEAKEKYEQRINKKLNAKNANFAPL